MGHSRPNWAVRIMSGVPPVATVERTSRFGSFVPAADSCNAANTGHGLQVCTRSASCPEQILVLGAHTISQQLKHPARVDDIRRPGNRRHLLSS